MRLKEFWNTACDLNQPSDSAASHASKAASFRSTTHLQARIRSVTVLSRKFLPILITLNLNYIKWPPSVISAKKKNLRNFSL